jgi:N-acyl-D-aspartate/D-glutamate deacylase
MLDVLITGGTVIDGTGAPGVRADVGVRDGRVVAVGEVDEGATTTVDADGLVVTPGFIDPHTHYDAQLFWDPAASPSNIHGVTTVIGGNCGFTLAPLEAEDADYLMRMMARVEGMPLAALQNGLPWDWRSFGDYLSRLDGRLGVNAGFLVGHCALRRRVMHDDAVGAKASPEQIDAMRALLHDSIAAGGLGFSTSRAYTHSDGDGAPVPSRHAAPEEVIAMCEVVQEHPGTTLEFITDGCLNGFSDDEMDLMARMSATARRPLNWNVLTVDASDPGKTEHQLEASTRAKALGGRVVALTMPTLVGMNMSFGSYCALFLFPGWKDILELPMAEKVAKLRDPEVRAEMDRSAHSPEAGVVRRLAGWKGYIFGDVYAPENQALRGKTVAEVAAQRGTSPFDTLLDVVIADDLRTVLWPSPTDDDSDSWKIRSEVWRDDRVLIGGSDAGAHLDRMCGAPYTTGFLADCLRGRRLLTLEDAVRLITSAPAALFGLRDRGVLRPGAHADITVFDAATVASGPVHMANDLPGNSSRLVANSVGVEHVFVNGRETVRAGAGTGDLPGTLLRSGRDTDTVEP